MTVSTRVQYCPNGNVTYNANGWVGNGGAAVTRVTVSGTTRLHVVWPTAGSGVASATIPCTGLTPGVQYTATVDLATVNTGPAVSVLVTGFAPGTSTSSIGPLFRNSFKVTFVATATVHNIGIVSAGATTAGQNVDIRSVHLEAGSSNAPYFDGDTPGGSWAAGPGSSISTFANYNDAPAAIPLTIVEFDARPPGPGDFFLDASKLDGPDFLVSTPRWTPIAEWTQFSIRRGRQRDDSPIQPGTCTITLLDYLGLYDPDNPSTPYQTNGNPILRSGMRVRVGVMIPSLGTLVYTPLFVGGLEDATIARDWDPTTVLSFVDDLSLLNNADIPPFAEPAAANMQTGWRAWWLMSFANKSAGDIDLTVGLVTSGRQMLPTSGGGNVGSALQQVADCEGGRVFAQANGRIKVQGHTDDFVLTTAATFTDAATLTTDIEYTDIQTSSSIKSLVNKTTVDRSSGGADNVTAQNDTSVALNGVKSESIDAPLANNFEAGVLAQWRANRRAKGATRIDSLTCTLSGQSGAWQTVAALDLGAILRARRTAFGRTIDNTYALEGIDYDIDVTGWQATFYTSPVEVTGLYPGQPQAFRLDTSALDGPDVMISF